MSSTKNKKQKKVTIKNIAEIAGVSFSTVGKALRDDPTINKNTNVEMIKKAQAENPSLKTRFLISRKVVNTKLGNAVRDALAQYKVPVLKTEISQRVSLAQAFMAGKNIFQFSPSSESAFEFENLYLEVSRLRWPRA